MLFNLSTGQVGRLRLNLYSTPCISLVSLAKPILQMRSQGVPSASFDGSEEHFFDQGVGKLHGIRSRP